MLDGDLLIMVSLCNPLRRLAERFHRHDLTCSSQTLKQRWHRLSVHGPPGARPSRLCPPLLQPLRAATSSLGCRLPEPRFSRSSCIFLFGPRHWVGRPGATAHTLTRLWSWGFGGRGPPGPGVTLAQEDGGRWIGVPVLPASGGGSQQDQTSDGQLRAAPCTAFPSTWVPSPTLPQVRSPGWPPGTPRLHTGPGLGLDESGPSAHLIFVKTQL